MKFKVDKYIVDENCHFCTDESGEIHKLDIFVDGLKNDDNEKYNNYSIVGKTIEVGWLTPYLEIAMKVSVLQD